MGSRIVRGSTHSSSGILVIFDPLPCVQLATFRVLEDTLHPGGQGPPAGGHELKSAEGLCSEGVDPQDVGGWRRSSRIDTDSGGDQSRKPARDSLFNRSRSTFHNRSYAPSVVTAPVTHWKSLSSRRVGGCPIPRQVNSQSDLSTRLELVPVRWARLHLSSSVGPRFRRWAISQATRIRDSREDRGSTLMVSRETGIPLGWR